ncbi:MAG: hypothetical protein ACLS3V_00695 [Streptococcus sp.]
MTDEKFLDKKMDRREFLKKQVLEGLGLRLVFLVHLLFSLIRIVQQKPLMGMKILASLVSTKLGLRLPCRRLATWWF